MGNSAQPDTSYLMLTIACYYHYLCIAHTDWSKPFSISLASPQKNLNKPLQKNATSSRQTDRAEGAPVLTVPLRCVFCSLSCSRRYSPAYSVRRNVLGNSFYAYSQVLQHGN